MLMSWARGVSIGVVNTQNDNGKPKPSSLAGLECDNAAHRPVAVMMPSDPETRPLSGIGQADLVIEMPVTPNGITRLMALFQCQTPKEIGSIRSAREDFIPLAAGFKAVYTHWGGEHGALGKLNGGIIDNVDAMKYEGTTFYRKAGIPRPHNGFSTVNLITAKAKELGYDPDKDFEGYARTTVKPAVNLANVANTINLDYAGNEDKDRVMWAYDPPTKTYLRSRGGTPEIDRLTGEWVRASVVPVMHTDSHVLVEGDQYIMVRTTGSGPVEVYQNGIVTAGTWQKDPARLGSKLQFLDSNRKEMKLSPGTIWIEIDI